MIQRDLLSLVCTKAPEKQIIYKRVKKDTPTSNPTYLNKRQARQEKIKKKSILRFGNFNIYIYKLLNIFFN